MASLNSLSLAAVGFFAHYATAQVFVGSNSSESSISISMPAPGKLSSSCNSTFSTFVTCDTTLPSIAFNGYFPSSDDLAVLCTSDYPSTGDFCAPVFDAWANGNDSSDSCSSCVLGSYQMQLGYSLGYDSDLAGNFSSLTASCQATGYPVTSPTAITVDGSALTASSMATTIPTSCATTYTVRDGDDCHSISKAQGVSTNNMLYLNGLEAGCTNFPGAGAQLCMPHHCLIYTVETNDTCYGIVGVYNGSFTMSQLVSWNIDISRDCGNLNLQVGNQICVSFPGNTTASEATAPASTATEALVPTNVVSGTNTDCGKYYLVQAGDTCASITQRQGISLQDFYFLNPEVNSTSCNNLYLGYSYCVQAVGNINTYPGYAGNPTNPCVAGRTTAPASCYATTYATGSAWVFPSINATAASNGTATSSYTSYVITQPTSYPVTYPSPTNWTPQPTQSGMVSGCTRFWLVQVNNTCYDIAQGFQITLDQLYGWNPALKGDCSGLITGNYICVSISTSTSSVVMTSGATSTSTSIRSTSSTATPTNGGTSPPGPTESGIPSDCDKWVLQKDGIYCYDMAQNAGISLSCLYQMNPALNTNAGECQGLYAGYAYCIGTASNECS
ncbi:carbohydrate-binding module family 50 protein [Polychaeton citri CBS 116435]|uniref:Carbohydrate-binding module family 50 protein n=1 Tax=Polychaeton citri CBS 116435 TaxID=1314669 RepID=A0A9P4Q121_9PEZI|nr:carbohydrate-binding module family 50 protein [Polychaeton citri CBS 116435]